MTLYLQSFSAWVNQQVAQVQSSATALLNMTVGSVTRAILEANASIALWVQWLILLVLGTTRAATSAGSDLDTWMADFGLTREPAVAATGSVTFSRFSPTGSALVLPGAQVKTLDGTQVFTVTADTGNSRWNAAQGGYLVPGGTASVTVPVQAVNPGVQGNVQAGAIALIIAAISGIDTVTNPAAFTNGLDAEMDSALRSRFTAYINTRSLATLSAIGYAVQSVQQGLTWSIQEGVPSLGYLTVTVDDGSGSPSSGLLAAVAAAVQAVRPAGTTAAVQGPSVVSASVTFTLTAAPGYVKANLIGPAVAAVAAFVDALPLGVALPYSRLAQVIYDSTAGIANVTLLQVNSGTADIGGGPTQVVRVSSVVAS